jgi:hypothetical protein
MTPIDLELAEGESLIATADELIYRQITEHLKHGDQVATHAFTGPSSEGFTPSYSRSSVVSAQDSRDWHTRRGHSPSLGVWAVTIQEVVGAASRAIDDSRRPLAEGEVRAPGHCFVDARGRDKLAVKELRAALWEAAMRRGEIPTRAPLQDGELDLRI